MGLQPLSPVSELVKLVLHGGKVSCEFPDLNFECALSSLLGGKRALKTLDDNFHITVLFPQCI
jgi:hypothetical protein